MLDKIMGHNKQQREHEQIFQKLILDFCNKLLKEAITHDTSKWGEIEYATFIESRDSLNKAQTGKDEGYQKYLKSDAIQHHILNNLHHPEYWDSLNQEMPLEHVVAMFFDWKSRSIQKGTDLEGFWEYNLEKLKNQPKAIAIVELLKKYNDNYKQV